MYKKLSAIAVAIAVAAVSLLVLAACYAEDTIPAAQGDAHPYPPREFFEIRERYFPTRQWLDAWFEDLLERYGLPINYPCFFGEIFTDDTGRLVVAIVASRAESADAQEFLAQIEAAGGARIIYVDYSARELNAKKDYLTAQWDTNPAMENVRFMYTRHGRIYVSVLYYTDEHIERFRREVSDSPKIVISGLRGERIALETPAPPARFCPLWGDEIRMEITAASQLPAYVTVTIFNDSDSWLTVGYAYSLEKFYDESWRQVPMSAFFRLIGLIVMPGEYMDFVKPLEAHTGSLEPGLYRIRKDTFRRDYRLPITEDDLHDLFAEFYIC